MAVSPEGNHSLEFLVSEANGHRSREEAILTSGENLVAGAVLELVAGKYVEHAGATPNGNSSAILAYDCDASAADAACVVIVRDAEVKQNRLTYETGSDAADIAIVNTELLSNSGIVVR